MTSEIVKQAAAELDDYMPGWEQRIDLNNLRWETPYTCVAGQLWGTLYNLPEEIETRDAYFYSDGYNPFRPQAVLMTELWRQEIITRLDTNKYLDGIMPNLSL